MIVAPSQKQQPNPVYAIICLAFIASLVHGINSILRPVTQAIGATKLDKLLPATGMPRKHNSHLNALAAIRIELEMLDQAVDGTDREIISGMDCISLLENILKRRDATARSEALCS